MTTQGLKYLIIVMAVLVLMLVYLAQTSGGSLGSDFGLGAVLSSAVIVVVSWRWGGWRQSKMCGGSLP